MVNKKLAALLATAVMLSQASLLTMRFAQADTRIPSDSENTQTESLKVASVIQHTGADTGTSADGVKRPGETPDIYTIDGGIGKLPTIIQVLPQDDDNTSLFVNGSEILRFHGTVDDKDSYTRVKTIADKLNRLLVTDSESLGQIRPTFQKLKNQTNVVIRVGSEVIATVDAETAKVAKETQPKLAFLYANRLRRALGEVSLQNKEYAHMLAASKANPQYKGTGRVLVGMASWYGPYFHGRRAADGSRFNQYAMTAAHKTLPFGTVVKVVNQRTKKSCYVKITDRGPYAHGRIIDLSRSAAKAIGMLGSGVAPVTVEVVARRS